jgi:hypothetical protein
MDARIRRMTALVANCAEDVSGAPTDDAFRDN